MGATSHSPRLRLVSSDSLEAEAKSGTTLSAGVAPPAEAQDVHLPSGASPSAGSELDDELVARVRRSEAQAFELLYRRHAEFAFNLAVRIQGSAVDVEDVVHDAFLKARERLEDLRDSAAFRPWLGSIVVRLVRTRLRRRKLLATLGLTAPEPVEIDSMPRRSRPRAARSAIPVYALLQTCRPTSHRGLCGTSSDNRLKRECVRIAPGDREIRIARAQRFLSIRLGRPLQQGGMTRACIPEIRKRLLSPRAARSGERVGDGSSSTWPAAHTRVWYRLAPSRRRRFRLGGTGTSPARAHRGR